MSNREAGKGDSYRKVDQDAFGTNYDNIFRKPKEPDPIPPVERQPSEEGQREE